MQIYKLLDAVGPGELTWPVSGSMRSMKALTVARTSSLHLKTNGGFTVLTQGSLQWLLDQLQVRYHHLLVDQVLYHCQCHTVNQRCGKSTIQPQLQDIITILASYQTIDRWSVDTQVLGTAVAFDKRKVNLGSINLSITHTRNITPVPEIKNFSITTKKKQLINNK